MLMKKEKLSDSHWLMMKSGLDLMIDSHWLMMMSGLDLMMGIVSHHPFEGGSKQVCMEYICSKQTDMQDLYNLWDCILEVMSAGPSLPRPTDEGAVDPEVEEVDVLSVTHRSHQSMYLLMGACTFVKLINGRRAART